MKTTEIRVRPVVRHAVTRFSQDERSAGSELVGEFANEGYAEEVAEALRKSHKPKQYAIVQRSFDFQVMVTYADYPEVAEALKAELEAEHGQEFRIYERELTDPMAIARVGLSDGKAELAMRQAGAQFVTKPE